MFFLEGPGGSRPPPPPTEGETPVTNKCPPRFSGPSKAAAAPESAGSPVSVPLPSPPSAPHLATGPSGAAIHEQSLGVRPPLPGHAHLSWVLLRCLSHAAPQSRQGRPDVQGTFERGRAESRTRASPVQPSCFFLPWAQLPWHLAEGRDPGDKANVKLK